MLLPSYGFIDSSNDHANATYPGTLLLKTVASWTIPAFLIKFSGPIAHPNFQPVALSILPAEKIVIVF